MNYDSDTMDFEWDPQKAVANLKKHRVAFEEAASVFGNDLTITVADPDHSGREDRFISIGLSSGGRVLMVSHTDRGDRVRVISARTLTRAERKAYEEAIK